jgi:hypothetical protein
LQTRRDLEIRSKSLLEHRLTKDPAFRDLTHQKLENNRNLVDCLLKSSSGTGRQGLEKGVRKMRVRSRIVQLNHLDSTATVQVSRPLITPRTSRERSLVDQLFSKLILVCINQGSQKSVEEDGLRIAIISERSRLVLGKKDSSIARSSQVVVKQDLRLESVEGSRR